MVIVGCIALTLCLAAGSRLRAQSVPLVRFGFALSMLEDVTPSDALAATRVWVKQVGAEFGGWANAEAAVFDDADAIARAFNTGATDFVAMTTPQYFALEKVMQASPSMTFRIGGGVEAEFVLATRTDVAAVAALKGRSIITYSTPDGSGISDLWLDVLLHDAGIAETDVARAQMRRAKKASQALLPVFFKQADAAMVPRSSYDTATELNPQLAHGLHVIAVSPPLLRGIICARRSLDPASRDRWVRDITSPMTAKLRQSFVILHIDQLIPWQPQYIERSRALYERYQALHAKKKGGRT